MKKLLIAALFLAMPCYAQFTLTPQWDVRTTGADTNGGAFYPGVSIPGADYSQQNSPQVTYTDLTIGSTTTQVTSVLNPFATCTSGVGYCGNYIHITGGTGCTTGWYQVVSTSTITATLNQAAGTAASICTGVLGGSMATYQAAYTAASAEDVVNVQSGTYAATNYTMLHSGSVVGYQITHGDHGTKPVFTTSSAINFFFIGTSAGAYLVQHVDMESTSSSAQCMQAGTTGSAVQYLIINDSKCNGAGYGINEFSGPAVHMLVNGSEFSNLGTAVNGFSNTPYISITNSYFHNNGTDINATSSSNRDIILQGDIFAFCTNPTDCSVINALSVVVDHCDFAYGAANQLHPTADYLQLTNSIYWGSVAGGGIEASLPTYYGEMNVAMFNNVIAGNATPNALPWLNPTNIPVTVDPFVNGAGGNFALNNTAGGGALLQGTGYPSSYGTTTTTGTDVGAVQRAGGVTVTVTGNFGSSN